MKGIHWVTLVVGYLLGSFFGLMQLLGLFGGLGKKQAAPPAAA